MQSLKVNNFILKKTVVYLLFIAVIISCDTKNFNTEKELLDYINQKRNGYTQNKSVNGYDFKLTYRPTDLLVNQEIGDNITSKKIKTLREKYNKYLYFNLSMGKNNQEILNGLVGNKNEFGVMVNQLAFGMNEKVHLYTQSKDTIELADFIYPRMYGMSKSTNILFVYPRVKDKLNQEVLNFTVEDLGFYTGEIKFKIDTKIINKEPQLLFKH